jgi:DNA-binding transcriptional regulator GbsR (MarR family)
VNRSVAQVHALLHMATAPLEADEICDTPGLARSNVSTALKELQSWKPVQSGRQPGDRREREFLPPLACCPTIFCLSA